MKLLIVYGTTEGQTEKISKYLRDEAEKSDHVVTLVNAKDEPPHPGDFDKVIIAGSVHAGNFQSPLVHYVRRYNDTLTTMQTAFVSVSLSAIAEEGTEDMEELHECVESFLRKVEWEPKQVEYVAGALKFVEYNWMKRFIMRQIAKNKGLSTNTKQDYEFTDWDQVKAFLDNFLKK